MKKKIWILVIGLLLIGTNLYAGNLTVSGKVGVGTTSPQVPLHISSYGNGIVLQDPLHAMTESAAAVWVSFLDKNGSQIGYFGDGGTGKVMDLAAETGYALQFSAGGVLRMVINPSTGNVGIGTTSPDTKFQVGDNSNRGNITVYGTSGVVCNIGTGSGATNCTSDIRLKENISKVESSLGKIMRLRPVTFNWKDKTKNQSIRTGFIAQEVNQVFPEFVSPVYADYLGIDHTSLIVPTIRAIQEIVGAVDITKASTSVASIQSFYQGTAPALIIGKEGNIDILGNIKTSGTISTGSISAHEFKTASGDVSISQSGDITVKNITSGDITTTGKITASGELSAGNIKSSGGIAANGNIVQTSPDLESYGIAMERTDESSQYHNWTFWHMNDKTNDKNGLEIWEYKANSKGEACTAAGLTCSPRIVLKEGGNIGIGNDPGNYKLYVDGDLSVNGDTYSKGGQWLLLSDMRVKENIAMIESPLAKILNMDGVSFNWKKDEFKGKSIPAGTHYGLIAQQIEKVLPEVVKEDPTGKKNVAYTEIIPVLIEAMKEQQKIIGELKGRIKRLEKGK